MHSILAIEDVDADGSYEQITRAVEDREWPALCDRLDRLDAAYVASPSLHTIVQLEGTLHAIVRAPITRLAEWTEARPEDRWGFLALGMAETYAGTTIRGDEPADEIPQTEWEAIGANFERAGEALNRSLALGARPGVALSCFGQCAMIDGADDLEHAALVRDLAKLDPNWLPAWSSALARSEPRWGGSVAAMDQLVDQARAFMTAPGLIDMLAGDYWWWRANWSSTWEVDLPLARQYVARGLDLPVAPRMRSSLHQLDAQILQTMNAPAPDVAAAWQAAVEADPAERRLEFELGRALAQAGDTSAAVAVMERFALSSHPDATRAANWLAWGYREGASGLAVDRAQARRWFEHDAGTARGKTNLADFLLEDDPDDARALALLDEALAEGHGFAGLCLARHHLDRGDKASAEAALRACGTDYPEPHYALARGLDEGWFGRPDAKGALAVTATLLPKCFHPWASVLHMTLLSAIGNWDQARGHGAWLKKEIEDDGLDMPDPLPAEVDRLLAQASESGGSGLLGLFKSPKRLHMTVEAPDLWTI